MGVNDTIKMVNIYNEIATAAFVNVFTLSKNEEVIALRNFNPKNEEHLFVLGVAKGLAGASSKKVALDVSKFQLWKLNRGIDKDCRMIKINKNYEGNYIDPNELLDFMREKAVSSSNDEQIFTNIYKAFYERNK